ncbi:MAG: hypothetical protein DSM106950_24170 [Stigonema ocellatum SAG 48.90 = DSM 106950]|nr:hypothetical protein [Stigonema ocellatum SAG 48.90 = DSM 106950]
MPPKIPDELAWQQAELLMQPIFIRVVDNIRKLLDVSPWTGTYEHVLIWPTGTAEETQALVTQLLQELEAATPEQAVEIRQTLSRLPVPHPGYHLCLKRQEQTVSVDMWDMCYQVCFLDYISGEETVVIDTSLIDETGDVDWQRLDVKAHELVERVFAQLPE